MLDPAQNHTFRDHYLEVDLDLSDVVFIATANMVDTIPGPLLDRMELVRLDGYTEDEKVFIARHHLLPRQLERAGLRPDEVDVHRRRAAADRHRLHPGGGRAQPRARARQGCSARWPPRWPSEPVDRCRCTIGAGTTCADLPRPARSSTTRSPSAPSVPGVATGLAVTGDGGDVLFIEASAVGGRARR